MIFSTNSFKIVPISSYTHFPSSPSSLQLNVVGRYPKPYSSLKDNIIIRYQYNIDKIEYIEDGSNPSEHQVDASLVTSSEANNAVYEGTNSQQPPNKIINVILSALLALGIFIFQNIQPESSVQLLKSMERDSPRLETVLCNGKPTIVDFYADWCENCKV
jgi:hypothetical protein